MIRRRIWLAMVVILSACGVIDRINDAPRASIESFTVSPNPVDRGDTLTIAWSTSHADVITLRDMPFDTNFGDAWIVTSQPTYTDLPATGTMTYDVPADFRRSLRFALEVTVENGETHLVRSEVVELQNYPCWHDPNQTCIDPPQEHPVMLQTYEHGYLLQQEDTGIVYLLKTDIPFWERLTVDDAEYDDKLDALGDALDAPENYLSQWGQHLDYPHEAVFDYAYVSWHDGRLLTLFGQLAAESGPAWTLTDVPE